MKKFILTALAIITFGISSKAGWFNNEAEQKEQERREYAEHQLAEEQKTNNNLGIIVVCLTAFGVTALGIGAAIGSKCRRASSNGH